MVGVGGEERTRLTYKITFCLEKERAAPLQRPCLGNPMDRKLEELQSIGSQRVRYDSMAKQQHFDIHKVSSLISPDASLSTNSLRRWDQSRSPVY